MSSDPIRPSSSPPIPSLGDLLSVSDGSDGPSSGSLKFGLIVYESFSASIQLFLIRFDSLSSSWLLCVSIFHLVIYLVK